MKVLAILWLMGSYEVTGQSSGIQLQIGQHGLTEVVSYLLNYELIPSLQEGPSLGDYVFKFGTTQFHVTKLQLHELTGQTSNVSVLDGNKMGISIGINKLALQGNITHIAGEYTTIAPNTDFNFLACRLDILFKFGHVKGRYDLTLETCKATVGEFKASGIYRNLLEGLFQISGQEKIMGEVCTYLERLTNNRLNNILSVKDNITISSSRLEDMPMRMIPRSLSTDSGFIVIAFEVTTGNEPFLGNLTFPQHAFKQTANDVILSINDELLSKISQLAIQNIFNEMKFEKTIYEITYNIQAHQKSVQSKVRSSEDGTCIMLNATLDVQSKGDKCIQFEITMNGVIPLAFNYSGATILASVDRDRLQMKYGVSSYERTCQPSEASTDMQKDILQTINNEFEALSADKTFSLNFLKNEWYRFKEAKFKTTNGGLSFSFGGVENNENMERFKSLYHNIYDRKMISFTFLDAQTVAADIPVTTVATTTTSTTRQISHTLYDGQTMKNDSQNTVTVPISASASLFLHGCTYLAICAAVRVCVGNRN